MKIEESVKKVYKYQWFLGFLGFLGVLGIPKLVFDNSSFLLFFGFFGFFAWFWEYRLQQTGEDERLVANRLKATSKAFNVSAGIIWVGAVFGNTVLLKVFPFLEDITNRYDYVMILIAFGFAIGLILQSYLTYRYDTKE